MRLLLLPAIVALCCTAPAWPAMAQTSAGAACRQFTLNGEVHAGQAWQQPIGGGLVFRMQPSQPTGWQFEIGPAKPRPGEARNYILLMTLPLRGPHVTMLNTAYATPAQDVVAYGPRPFSYLLQRGDAPRAQRLAERLMAPQAEPLTADAAADTLQTLRRLRTLPAGTGELRITGSHIERGRSAAGSTAPDAHFGSLHRLAFRVTLVVPAATPLPAGLTARAVACPRPFEL